jgi:S1-C subfamily serine protease
MLPDQTSPTQEEVPARPANVRMKISAGVVIAALALGLLGGYGIGWLSFDGSGDNNRPLYDEALVKSVFDMASPAVVEIGVLTPQSTSIDDKAVGSGFLVDDSGHIVTNYHVVADALTITVRLHDGVELSATRLGTSPADDLALLRVDPEAVSGIQPLRLADPTEVTPGQMAIAIGSPFEELNSVSVGVVSGIGRSRRSVLNRPIPDLVQTDAALNPGNSGGPLLNAAGEVIGVNSSVQILSSMQVGVGFAISIKTLNSILPDLRNSEEIKRAWLGIEGRALDKGYAEYTGVTLDKGIYVLGVCRGSPADAARLIAATQFSQPGLGDIITAVDGRPLESMSDLTSYLNDFRPGDRITLTVVRRNREYRVDVGLDEWSACQ